MEKLTQSLCELNIISNKEGFIHDVMLREALGSTGFENQIAIPHGKSQWVNETRIAVAKLASPRGMGNHGRFAGQPRDSVCG
ncbi:PTS sugar transporter subunit IIA [Pantoea ananatis]